MEKVKLTSEQAKSIESFHKANRPGSKELESLVLGIINHREYLHEYKALNDMELDTLLKAIYIGYEVEYTPEELVKQYYDRALELWNIETFFDEKGKFFGELQGIKLTLDLLGIEIEGVNKK